MAMLYNALIRGAMDNATLTNFGNAWIDVRDVALAHMRALERPAAEGRVIVSVESFKVQDWRTFPLFIFSVRSSRKANTSAHIVDAAHWLETMPYTRGPVARGDATYDKSRAVHELTFDTSKMCSALGMGPESLITMEQCVRDFLADFQAREWKSAVPWYCYHWQHGHCLRPASALRCFTL